MGRHSNEYKAFVDLTDRLLKVPKAVVDERIAAYKAEREKIPSHLRPGPNPRKKKSSGRVEK